MSNKHKTGKAYLAIHKTDQPGNLMYVIIDDRALFDLIDLPENGDVKVRYKVVKGEQHIIFQHFSQVLSKVDFALWTMAYDFKKLAGVA
ncbi:MAG: hypothetical protein ACJ71W_05845 [Terriglobales bacterium]